MILMTILLLLGDFSLADLTSIKVETMTASWYGPGFQGRPMANGECFDRHAATVAHPNLPFGTKLVLLNLKTSQSAEAVVKDRGPFVVDRDLDVSEALARRLGFHHDGVTDLIVIVLSNPLTPEAD